MEGLSILTPLRSFLQTHIESDVSFCPMTRKMCKIKRWRMGDASSPSPSDCCSVSSSSSSSFRYRSSNMGFEFSSGRSNTKVHLFCDPKRRSSRASLSMVLALDEETAEFEGYPEDVELSPERSQSRVVINLQKEKEKEKEKEKLTVLQENDRDVRRELLIRCNGRIDVRKLGRCLWDCQTADCIEEVFKVFDELPPPPIYSSLIRGLGIDKKLDSAFALVDWLKMKSNGNHMFVGLNLFIYNSLLGALKQAGEFDEVDRVMEDMEKQGIVPDVVTFNSLMSIYIEQERHNAALNVIMRIEKEGLSPSPVTYSTALVAYWKMEDVSGAVRFYIELKDKYLKGEIGKDADEDWEVEFSKIQNFTIRICYQVMRQWIVKRDDPTSRIMKVLTDMDKAQISPGRLECEKLIWACTQEGHYVVAKELYERIRERESDISLSVCNHVIWLMGKAKKWWAALEVYEDLLDKGPKPNNLSYELIMSHFNILLSAASKRGIWRWGVRLINKMQDKGLKPGSREWNAVIVACSKASETTAAVQVFKRMIEQGEKPTILSYGALLSALEKGKLYDEAFSVWEHMCKVGIKPNLYAYTILASIYIRKGEPERVDSVIHDMVNAGVEPTVVTFNAIISSCARNNLGSAAFEWFHRMKIRNVTPNEITYEMLIEALARDAKPRLAFEMYIQSRREGFSLSAKAYDTVIEYCNTYKASIDLSSIGPRPADKKRMVKTRKTLSEFCNFADVPRRGKPFDRKEVFYLHDQGDQ